MTSACDGVNRARNTSPLRPSIAAATTERACTSRPTLVRSQNTGASFTPVGKAEHGTTLGNPRDCASEAPASNYSTPRAVTPYGLMLLMASHEAGADDQEIDDLIDLVS